MRGGSGRFRCGFYLPAGKSPAAVVLFSHGLGGTRAGSRFLGEHWAARGYLAVFLQHPGSDDSVWKDRPAAERAAAMREAASGQNLNLRVKDVPAVIDQLERWNKAADHPLAGRVDVSKVGMSGHSFGAVTTQAVSGQSFPLVARPHRPADQGRHRVQPQPSGCGRRGAGRLAASRLPWLLMTGTKDIARIGGGPIGAADMAARLAVFPALPAGGKYELVLDGAEHSAFTDRPLPGETGQRNPNHHRAILALSTAFWDAYLMAMPKPKPGSTATARARSWKRRTSGSGSRIRATCGNPHDTILMFRCLYN